MTDADLQHAIAVVPLLVNDLVFMAPTPVWADHPLVQRWLTWRDRQFLTDTEYLRLENYLSRCCERAKELRREQLLAGNTPSGGNPGIETQATAEATGTTETRASLPSEEPAIGKTHLFVEP